MKTILSLFTTLALIIGAASLDAYRLDAGLLFSALAVAALFAFALNDVRRPPYRVRSARITRFPGTARCSTGRAITGAAFCFLSSGRRPEHLCNFSTAAGFLRQPRSLP